jgi:hypothetical protein
MIGLDGKALWEAVQLDKVSAMRNNVDNDA